MTSLSELLFPSLLVAAGLGMLAFGSEWLVRGSVNIAKKLRVSQLIIGLTIVAFGTSTQLVVSIDAAILGKSDISLANVVGGNITNIGLILGVCAAIAPISFHIGAIRREVPIMILVSLALFLIAFIDDQISQIEQTLLLAGLAVFVFFSIRRSRRETLMVERTLSNDQKLLSASDVIN